MLRLKGLIQHLRLAEIKVPAREIFAFTIPLMTLDLMSVLMQSLDTLLLGHFHDMRQVAIFRVALPAAAMNLIIMRSFALLYTPAAARLFAKEDYGGINDLYRRTAVWMAVLSFPIFAMTFSMAQPLTRLLYGVRYEESGVVLSLLSLGYYFNAALGFNGLTVQVLGKLRYNVIINLVAAVTSVIVNLLLVPRYGAIGAAIGTSGTMIFHNILKQAGLKLASGISLFDKKCFSFYPTVAIGTAGLLVIRFFCSDNIYVLLFLTGLVCLSVFAVNKKNLKIAETFPELVKVPLLRSIFA
jgi:O-antigen/teichoic acid export membrane protein